MRLLFALILAVMVLPYLTCGSQSTGIVIPHIRTYQPGQIKIWVDPRYSPEQVLALNAALALYPCNMFTLVYKRDAADVVLRPNDGTPACDSGSGGTMDIKKYAGIYQRCNSGPNYITTVAETAKFSITEWYRLFAHEIGHATGLKDLYPKPAPAIREIVSIMQHNVLAYPMIIASDGYLSPRLRKWQMYALVQDYCPR